MRRSAVRTAAGVLLLSLAVAADLPGQNAARNSPQRPLAVVRLNGAEYLPAADFGARFGLKPLRSADGRKLTLKSNWTTIELEADTRECAINGVRVFLGEAIRDHRGALHVSRIDAEKLITPILLPGSGQTSVPAVRTIVIDPGHGGSDPGMENKALRLQEKTLALDTALRLKQELERQGYKVVLTRRDDRQLARSKKADLQKRGELTLGTKADLFISLHYNSVESGADRVTGVEVYSLTPQYQYSHSDPEREDSTAAIANLGNRHDHWNALLAYNIHRELLAGLKASDRGLKRGRLAVLRFASCPAVLVEAGFLSNDAEARKIATPAYRQKIAESVAEGVRVYANLVEGVRRQRAGQR
ncbi:MAG: N-acetylmuramoyl-L-alanine amidase [Opitutaceae bacterium]|nr:N-acetylmuramoyl-L-alanine amidase [Opitutaceae bacterium]